MSPSRLPSSPLSGGFTSWPPSVAHSEVTALVFTILFCAVVFSGVVVMRNDPMKVFHDFADQVCKSSSAARREGPALQCVDRVESLEKVEGAFSFPDKIKGDLRFRVGPQGELILRVNDGGWRDAGIADLAPVQVDLLHRRDMARAAANTRGSGMSTRAILDQRDRQGVPKFIRSTERPRDRHVTMVMRANFYVVNSIPYSTDAPLFDWAIERDNPLGTIAARMARVNQLMRYGAT